MAQSRGPHVSHHEARVLGPGTQFHRMGSVAGTESGRAAGTGGAARAPEAWAGAERGDLVSCEDRHSG